MWSIPYDIIPISITILYIKFILQKHIKNNFANDIVRVFR